MSSLVIIGQGYVGLPLAMRSVEVGHTVMGIDTDANKVENLMRGVSHVEDVPEIQLMTCVNAGRYVAYSELRHRHWDYAIITVPTPLRDGVPDLSFVEEAARTVGRLMIPGATIILESTSYPGTTEDVVLPILEKESGLKLQDGGFYLGFSPERIDPGNSRWNFQSTPKLVSGLNAESLDKVRKFYETVCDEVVVTTSPKVAELSKVFENTFRAINIALVNELAMLAGELDISVWDVLDAAQTKPFGFMRFDPGPGIGGHCIGVDDKYLSWQVERKLGKPFRMIKLAQTINSHMPEYVVQRVMDLLNLQHKSVNGSRILILGLAYKAGTSDVRESPALEIVEKLIRFGAKVEVSDPYTSDKVYSDLRYEGNEYNQFDLVVVVTAHEDFDYEKLTLDSQLVLDCRHKMSASGNVVYL